MPGRRYGAGPWRSPTGAPPRDPADDQCRTGPGERDRVEPAAAVPAGQQYVGGLHGGLVAFGLREEAALDGGGDDVLALVPAGVVDGERRAGGRRTGQGDVLLVERLGGPAAVEADQPEDGAPQGEGHDDERVRAGLREAVGSCRVGVEPRGVGGERDEPGPQVGDGKCVRRTGREAAGPADRAGPARLVAPDGAAHDGAAPHGVAAAARRAAQRGVGRQRAHRRVGPAQDLVHHLDDGEAGEARHQGVDEGAAGGGHVQRPADRVTHGGQRGLPGPGPLPLGDVDDRAQQPEGGVAGAAGAVQAVGGDQEDPVTGDAAEASAYEMVAYGALTCEDTFEELFGPLRVVEPEGVGEAEPDVLLGPDALDEGVGPDEPELRVEHEEAHGGLGEEGLEQGTVQAARRGPGPGRGLGVRHGSTCPSGSGTPLPRSTGTCGTSITRRGRGGHRGAAGV